jgi:hypothetical protein
VGRISGRRGRGGGPFKSRKGFGFHVRQARARPSNTTVRELLSNSRYTEAVLDFLGRRGWERSRRELFVNKRQDRVFP